MTWYFLSNLIVFLVIPVLIDEQFSRLRRLYGYMPASNVNDILLFLSVVETGSFVTGGKVHGLSRSAAGKAVGRLEDGYGVRLLNRTTRSLSLTEEGRILFEHGTELRTALEATDASMTAEPGMPRGTLRITAPDAIGRRLLLPVVKQFLDQWPNVQIEMNFSDRIDNIVDDGFDLAIRIGVTTPPLGLIARTLLTDTPVLCALPSYLDTHTRPADAEQLSTHDLLQFTSRGIRQSWRLRETDGTWIRIQGQSRLRLESGEALRDAALAGMGIALLPKLLVGADIETGQLEQILPDIHCGEVPIVALYPHRRHLESRVRRFIDLLASTLRQA